MSDQKARSEHVLKGVMLTEKTAFQAEHQNVYSFDVPLSANKADIRKAVESAFGVRVLSVNTITRLGRPKRHRAHFSHGQTKKRAMVKLHSEDRISLY
ncbi:MAG: 50S ribosomal protein L23 [Planctomycetaceae bacterium]|jgi:large subunit ribosomal protein L23|nr:50S ribosomal protein L23 [Planctomycetaceae bacterium]